jgi:hypothetical protein
MRTPENPARSVVRKTIRPGQKGTRRFIRDWGERLVCVRYRFDAKEKIRYTTVEIVSSEPRPWIPPRRPPPYALVYLKVDRNDWKAIRRLRDARVWFDGDKGLWRTRYDVAERLRLKARIVKPTPTPYPAPRYAHQPEATNRNLSDNSRRSS